MLCNCLGVLLILVDEYCRCLVSCLSAMLQSSPSLDFSNSQQLQRQCLRTIGIIITSSPPSTFSMLFAQQLPAVLCQCLDASDDASDGGGYGDSLMRGPRMGTEEFTMSSTIGSRLTSFAYCAHTLALLLHTVSSQWGNIPFPLEVILVPGLMSDFDQAGTPQSSRGGGGSSSNRRDAFAVGVAPEGAAGAGAEAGEVSVLDESHEECNTSLMRSAEAMYSTSGAEKISLRQVRGVCERVTGRAWTVFLLLDMEMMWR